MPAPEEPSNGHAAHDPAAVPTETTEGKTSPAPSVRPVSDGRSSISSLPPVVDVRFRGASRVRAFECSGLRVNARDLLVVETDRGPELGEAVAPPRSRYEAEGAARLPRVLRRADPRDLTRADHNRAREREARQLCMERSRAMGLDMKVVRVDYRFDGGKAVFYFTAEQRIDFRELVREMAHSLHTRIEMRQIGARDETRLVGGIGPCGRELCCSSWLQEFANVTVKMAKEQDLALNPPKLAGMCGRLKCCLRYEYETYADLRRGLPRVGSRVNSVQGEGKVVRQLVLRQRVLVVRDEDGVPVELGLEDLVEKRPDPETAPPAS